MATSGYEITSDEILYIKCFICNEKGRNIEAEEYCLDCKNYYCSRCVDVHTMIPVLKGHKLLDKSDTRSLGPDGSLPSFPTQRCALHQSDIVNMYCKTHDEVACVSCIALDHSTCTEISSIPAEVDNLCKRGALTNIKLKLNQSKKFIAEIQNDKEKAVDDLKKLYKKSLNVIKEFRQEIDKILDRLETESVKELTKEFDRKVECLNTEIKDAKDTLDTLNELACKLKSAEGNIAQEFVIIKSSDKTRAKAEDLEASNKLSSRDALLTFTIDENLTAFLNERTTLGTVSDTTSSRRKFIPKTSLYKVKKQWEINVKLDNDGKDCRITGSCFNEDGFLLLTDNVNKKLKRLDMSTEKIKDYIDLVTNPVAVCNISNMEAAVTLYNNTIQFVSLGSTLTATYTIPMNHWSYGLAYTSGRLFLSDETETIYMHDMEGKKLKEVTGDRLQCYHIAVSVDGHRILLADREKGLVILDIEGNRLFTITFPKILEARGVCTDGRNVFICGLSCNSIFQIGQDYQLLGEIGNIEDPLSISFDHHNSRLIVSQHGSNNITVMDLE